MANTLDSKAVAALEYVWGTYRTWALTARKRKNELSAWRLRVFLLTVGGALLTTAGQQLSVWGIGEGWLSVSGTSGVLGGISLALAAYFSREILNPESERRWVRARSMAEALKAEIYLFRVGVSPYDAADAAARLLGRTEELVEDTEDVATEMLSAQQRRDRMPTSGLSVDEYVRERVSDQIEHFYRPRAREYQAILSRGRKASFWLGGLAAVLGVFGAAGSAAGWAPVITTIVAAVAAYLYAERYQYLIVSYQATARRLEALRTHWKVSGDVDGESADRDAFVRACEETISVENSAWMAKWSGENADLETTVTP